MKSKQFFELLVDDLTELEMTDLLEACEASIYRNRWTELRKVTMGDFETIEDLEDKIVEKEEEISDLEGDKMLLEREANKALDFLNDGKIDEAKTILSNL